MSKEDSHPPPVMEPPPLVNVEMDGNTELVQDTCADDAAVSVWQDRPTQRLQLEMLKFLQSTGCENPKVCGEREDCICDEQRTWYIAKHRESGDLWQLYKPNSWTYDSRDVLRIQRQVEVLSNCQHPNIIGFGGSCMDAGNIYLAFEYATGGSLYEKLQKEQRFSERVAANFVAPVMEALRYLHARSIMHRSIKSEFVYICSDGKVKLGGFIHSIYAPSNRRKSLCGTLDYLPPEMLSGDNSAEYSRAIDLWTVGVLAYELLTGEAPFTDSSTMDTVRRIKKGDMTPLPSTLSSEATDFVNAFLQLDPDKRISLDTALSHPWIIQHCDHKSAVSTHEAHEQP